MKRYGNLFETITSFSNLLLASEKARRGKRMKEGCASFEMHREEELWRLYDELAAGAWFVYMYNGDVYSYGKGYGSYYVWPVRGGQ